MVIICNKDFLFSTLYKVKQGKKDVSDTFVFQEKWIKAVKTTDGQQNVKASILKMVVELVRAHTLTCITML